MMKKLVLALLVLSGMTASVLTAHPRFAHADESCFLIFCSASFGADPPRCALGDVDVTGSAAVHRFAYTLHCGGYGVYGVQAGYDVTRKQAQEKLTTAGSQLEANWTCADDPWVAQKPPACILLNATLKPNPTALGLPDGRLPVSVTFLDAQSIHVLAAQLQNALNQPLQPAPKPSILTSPAAIRVGPGVTLPASPTQPDLVAAGISGPSTLNEDAYQSYTATVRNDGADVYDQVEVLITYADPVENIDGTVISAPGFSCSSTTNYAMDCVGGSLAQGQSVAISFSVYAIQQPGLGKLQVTVHPNNTVAESNTANNTVGLDVTVQ